MINTRLATPWGRVCLNAGFGAGAEKGRDTCISNKILVWGAEPGEGLGEGSLALQSCLSC